MFRKYSVSGVGPQQGAENVYNTVPLKLKWNKQEYIFVLACIYIKTTLEGSAKT